MVFVLQLGFRICATSCGTNPWGHNRLIISKIKNTDEALFYCNATIENGWNREQLENQLSKNDK